MQVSASFDAALDIVGGKINIHVLMAMAAFASVFMGNIMEGGLLLAMFNLAHIAEEYFTSRSMIDVKELKENHPDFALVLDLENGNNPSFSDLKYHKVPVNDLEVGAYILVKAGEVCVLSLFSSSLLIFCESLYMPWWCILMGSVALATMVHSLRSIVIAYLHVDVCSFPFSLYLSMFNKHINDPSEFLSITFNKACVLFASSRIITSPINTGDSLK